MRERMTCYAALFLLVPALASAQGFIIPDSPHALALTKFTVTGKLVESAGSFVVEHEFYNPGRTPVQGVFYFPLPPDAQVTAFSLHAGGRELQGELLDAAEARKIYTDIVRKSLDPALLEMMEQSTFRASIFPIPPGEKRGITLDFATILPVENDLVKLQFPLRGQLKAEGRILPPVRTAPIESERPTRFERHETESSTETSVAISIESSVPIGTIYSPSHALQIDRKNENAVALHLERSGALDGNDLIVYYVMTPAEISMRALSYRPRMEEDGYLALFVSPRFQAVPAQVARRDILWLVDVSGSMRGPKLDQARQALSQWLQQLNPEDRFKIITFSTQTRLFRETWSDPGPDLRDALAYVARIEAQGGTNIDQALREAAAQVRDSQQAIIVFMTDGLPSVGVREPAEILKNLQSLPGARIFTFGLGYDVNTRLLDGIARMSHTFSTYISPDENLEERLGEFAAKIRYPVLTEVRLAAPGAEIYDLYPSPLPDVYLGQLIVVLGRYHRTGAVALTLTGVRNEEKIRIEQSIALPRQSHTNDFLAPLWAARKIGFLLDEIQLNGETDELRKEVIALSTAYGIVTPYTSYLADDKPRGEAITFLDAGGNRRFGIEQRGETTYAPASPDFAPPPEAFMNLTTGRQAVAVSESKNALKAAERVGGAAFTSPAIRMIEGHRFIQDEQGQWVEATYRGQTIDLELKFAGEAYFLLFERFPEIRPFLQLGEKVVFSHGKRWIKTSDSGVEQLPPEELERRLR